MIENDRIQRKLISTNSSVYGLFFLLLSVIIILYCIIAVIIGDLERRDVIMSFIFLSIFMVLCYWSFSFAHPVYFDANIIYYKKSGRQYSIRCKDIYDISVSTNRGLTTCELSFYDDGKRKKTINFSMVSDISARNMLLSELQSIIRRTNKHFQISN